MNLRLALALAAVMACSNADAAPRRPDDVSVEGPVGAILPRDTLPYTLRWSRSPSSGVTGYRITVTASPTPPGTTTGLPTNVNTDTAFAFTAINLTYDSIQFTASVRAVKGSALSQPSTRTWSVIKTPAPPGPIQVDSSQIPAFSLLDVRPNVASVMVGGQQQLCAFFWFTSGHVAMRSIDAATCGTRYAITYTATQRAVTSIEQQWVDCGGQFALDAGCSVGVIPRDPFLRVGMWSSQ